MAHSLSAQKRVRQALKRRARNRYRKELLKEDVKGFTVALAAGDVAKSAEALTKTVARLDRIASKGTIHKNTAARKRSRLTKKLNALKAGGVKVAVVGAKKPAKAKATKAKSKS